MYGKIFDSMYDGTLYGQWEALVTFQQLIVLCDADGIIDMTPPAIAARTSIPLEIIKKGLEVLEKPDPYSRTAEQDGRRLELIDAHRPWGWHIVNHSKYQHMQDADTIRAQTRERVRRHRETKDLARYGNDGVTGGNAEKRHTDTDTNTVKPLGGKPPIIVENPEFEAAWKGYPKRSGNNPKADALKCWKARINDGVTVQAMVEGLGRYAAWCLATDKIGTETVMQASRFFGKSRPFEQEFTLPRETVKANGAWKMDDNAINAKAAELKITIAGLTRPLAVAKIEQFMAARQ